MSDATLTLYSSWASIISFFVSVISFLYVRSIKANIVKFRRKQRLHAILDDVRKIPDDATPLSAASKTKISSLKRNIPVNFLSKFSKRGRIALEIHKHSDAGKIIDLKEAIDDWTSFSGDL